MAGSSLGKILFLAALGHGLGGCTGKPFAGGATGGSSHGGAGEGGATDSGGADPGGTDSGGTDSGGTNSGGTNSGGTNSGGTDSGGTAGAGGSDGSGGSPGTPCTWGTSEDCPPGQFCNAFGCASGTCMVLPAEGSSRNPVCGCDGLTYWNPSVAASRGQSVQHTGECESGTACGGFAGLECPGSAHCNHRARELEECNISDSSGTCWVMPAACPPQAPASAHACLAPACAQECPTIKSGQTWYEDNLCPVMP